MLGGGLIIVTSGQYQVDPIGGFTDGGTEPEILIGHKGFFLFHVLECVAVIGHQGIGREVRQYFFDLGVQLRIHQHVFIPDFNDAKGAGEIFIGNNSEEFEFIFGDPDKVIYHCQDMILMHFERESWGFVF